MESKPNLMSLPSRVKSILDLTICGGSNLIPKADISVWIFEISIIGSGSCLVILSKLKKNSCGCLNFKYTVAAAKAA